MPNDHDVYDTATALATQSDDSTLGRQTTKLLPTALREYLDTTLTTFYRNHRYNGHRESSKFNLAIQSFLTIATNVFTTVRLKNNALRTQELNLYPTTNPDPNQSEVALFCYIHEQMRFKEYLLSKDIDVRWYE